MKTMPQHSWKKVIKRLPLLKDSLLPIPEVCLFIAILEKRENLVVLMLLIASEKVSR